MEEIGKSDFKIGDIVCCNVCKFPCIGRILNFENRLMKIKSDTEFGGDWCWLTRNELRHATKKEIIKYTLRCLKD